ncbi:hypothetical protein K2173_015704 [Erythroxylum novogranatense]|uniref:Uncharacterized protein n=1 Tax=Erythroxylum novogranatense TaxID=1862640 RepID=A0AAV8SET3_9ROSI|nr:hypothetical protein K2173_015704 [Erythroxylum novogranatense]
MTPQEEKLVLELHAKLGNRWSRIARKLPGRTDNEIKNYWRTHTRKKAQERKRAISPSFSSSTASSNVTTIISPFHGTGAASFYDTGGLELVGSGEKTSETVQLAESGFSMEEFWKDIDTIEQVGYGYREENCNFSCPSMASPTWEYCTDTLWRMDGEESKMLLPYEYGAMFLTG